jgi:50S ribosomal protein L16 3-hydroxylase
VSILTTIGDLTVDRFLERHWQKTPLLVREALTDLPALTSREKIIDLATRPGVDARLVRSPESGSDWTLHRGPFEKEAFDCLPRAGWTVLVQEANRHVTELADLIERYRFVPNWRLDDVMVSYATDRGGVGPHVDRYDVFLIQVAGSRRWRIGAEPLAEVRLQPGTDYPVLATFEPDREWVLNPGDMLYLPPGVPHDGVALGDCVTFSIGFSVPDPRELYSAYLRQLGPRAYEQVRYRDQGLERPSQFGEITTEARRRLRDGARQLLDRPGEFDRFLGRHLTRPLRGEVLPDASLRVDSVGRLRGLLRAGASLDRSAPSHFAWYADDEDAVWLFVGGEEYPLGPGRAAAAESICGITKLDSETLLPLVADESLAVLLLDLVFRGFLRPRPTNPDRV